LFGGCNSICVALQIAGEYLKHIHALNQHASHSPEKPGNIRGIVISIHAKVTGVNTILKCQGNVIEITFSQYQFHVILSVFLQVKIVNNWKTSWNVKSWNVIGQKRWKRFCAGEAFS